MSCRNENDVQRVSQRVNRRFRYNNLTKEYEQDYNDCSLIGTLRIYGMQQCVQTKNREYQFGNQLAFMSEDITRQTERDRD